MTRSLTALLPRATALREGALRLTACALVDDDPDYELGLTLATAMPARVMLRHQRCYSCFRYGSSCSELAG